MWEIIILVISCDMMYVYRGCGWCNTHHSHVYMHMDVGSRSSISSSFLLSRLVHPVRPSIHLLKYMLIYTSSYIRTVYLSSYVYLYSYWVKCSFIGHTSVPLLLLHHIITWYSNSWHKPQLVRQSTTKVFSSFLFGNSKLGTICICMYMHVCMRMYAYGLCNWLCVYIHTVCTYLSLAQPLSTQLPRGGCHRCLESHTVPK